MSKSNRAGAPGNQALFISPNLLTFGEPRVANDLPSPASTIIFSRLLAGLTGAGIVAASTFAVVSSQHLQGADAVLPCALAAGLVAGAVVLPRASIGLGIVLVLALVCGEGFGLISQLDRVVMLRDAQASTVNGTNEAHGRANARLTAALAAQVDQGNAARSAIATPDCKMECRGLLETQADKLTAEIADARVGLYRVGFGIDPGAGRRGVDRGGGRGCAGEYGSGP